MPASDAGHFEQADNAQAAGEVVNRLIVGQHVTQETNDKQQLVPSDAAIAPVVTCVKEVLVDSSFVFERTITQLETDATGRRTGLAVLAAVKREPHGSTVEQLEALHNPLPPPDAVACPTQLTHRISTVAGRARYKLRQQTVEPVFRIIEAAHSFRRFLLRGLTQTSHEWALVCSAYNLKRLHILITVIQSA